MGITAVGEEGRRDGGGYKAKTVHTYLPLRPRLITSWDENDRQMAIAGVQGNVTYTTTCLERERQEEEELNQQVFFGINM